MGSLFHIILKIRPSRNILQYELTMYGKFDLGGGLIFKILVPYVKHLLMSPIHKVPPLFCSAQQAWQCLD